MLNFFPMDPGAVAGTTPPGLASDAFFILMLNLLSTDRADLLLSLSSSSLGSMLKPGVYVQTEKILYGTYNQWKNIREEKLSELL